MVFLDYHKLTGKCNKIDLPVRKKYFKLTGKCNYIDLSVRYYCEKFRAIEDGLGSVLHKVIPKNLKIDL